MFGMIPPQYRLAAQAAVLVAVIAAFFGYGEERAIRAELAERGKWQALEAKADAEAQQQLASAAAAANQYAQQLADQSAQIEADSHDRDKKNQSVQRSVDARVSALTQRLRNAGRCTGSQDPLPGHSTASVGGNESTGPSSGLAVGGLGQALAGASELLTEAARINDALASCQQWVKHVSGNQTPDL